MLLGLKLVLFALWAVVFLSFATVVILLRPFNSRVMIFLSRIFTLTGLKIFGVRFNFKAPVWFYDGTPKIIIANHQGSLDVLLVGAVMPLGTVILGKTAILLVPLFGICFWLSGNIFIDRFDGKKVRRSMQRVNRAILEEGKSVWIMPEGTRSRGRGLLPFKRGAFVAAIRTGVPIVPVCFSPYADRSCTDVSGIVLAPIETQEISVDELMDTAYRNMSEAIAKLEGA